MSADSIFAESFRKVFYDLRPGKQIERRILLDAFLHLTNHGFSLRDYTYLGFGSVFFYDFSMFYRYLGFKRMISLEKDQSIGPRLTFNCPFKDIEIELKSAEEYIPSIDKDEKYVTWLDYDYPLSAELLSDIVNISATLSIGSILLITVDAKAPKASSTIKEFRHFVRSAAKDFLPDGMTDAELLPINLARISRDILHVAISKGLKSRKRASFAPLFSFWYDDSRPMYTFGGMLVDDALADQLKSATHKNYFRTSVGDDIFEIDVPRLTKKERIAFDQTLPEGLSPFDESFGITDDEAKAYAKLFRYFPSYVEAL